MTHTEAPHDPDNRPAVGGPVERQVRPVAWMRKDGTASTHPAVEGLRGYAPLYGQAAIDSAVAAERERCAAMCEAEHVGESLDDGKLCDQDFCYNNALRDAAAAIRGT